MTDTTLLHSISHDAAAYANYKIIRRNGSVVPFEPSKISVALTKAFIAVQGSHAASSAAVRDQVHLLTDAAVSALMRRKPEGGAIAQYSFILMPLLNWSGNWVILKTF